MDYNLLEEKWIPVLWKDGHSSRAGIIEALTQAGRIRQIAASNPMDRLAILRFLLALLYWCKGNPPDDKGSVSSFPPHWFKKLDEHKDYFNLLGNGERFYQCRPKSGKETKLSANYLVQEVPTGTNSWHFCHSTDERDGLCPACCAAGLLRLPLFATSGGRGKPPGVNQKPPVYFIPLGRSLAETLCLSWIKVSDSVLGTPTWEKPDQSLPKHGKVPLLLGLTWLPRRVWLDDPVEFHTKCISCGMDGPLIRQCVFAGIGSAKTDGEGEPRLWNDPHTLGEGEEILKPGNALGASDAAAGEWTRTAAGLIAANKAYAQKSMWIVSFATVKNDKYLEATEREVALPNGLDDQQAQEGAEKIEKWQKEGWKLVGKARPRGTSRKHLEIPPAVAAIRPHVEAKVSEKAAELISGGEGAWEQASREYAPMMSAVAKSLSPGVTTAALRRRRQIEYAKPDMRPKKPANGKTKGKKGGSSDSDRAIHPSPDTFEIW